MGEGGRSSSLAVLIHKEDSSRGALVARRLLWGAALNHLAFFFFFFLNHLPLFNPHNKPARWVLSPPFHRLREMTRLPKRSLADERCLCLQTLSLFTLLWVLKTYICSGLYSLQSALTPVACLFFKQCPGEGGG